MHASHTHLGALYDTNLMAVVFYVGYQSIVSKFNTDDNVLLYLSHESQMDAREVANKIAYLPITNPDREDWLE